VADPLHTTLSVLEHTRNQAAVPVLVAALESQHESIRAGAIHALVKRRSSAGHTAVLRHFPRFGERDHAALAESLPTSSHNLKQALHDAVVSEREDLCEGACHLILLGRAYDHLPTLVGVAEHRHHRHSDQAAATLIRLTRLLHEELAGRRPQKTRDPFFMRRQVLPSLERSVLRFGEHQRLEIVDAFLLLVPPTSPTLGKILADASQTSYEPVVASLRSSAVTAIVELLTQLMHDTDAPRSVLEIVAERADRKFLDYLLHHVGMPVSLRVLENMKRMRSVSWLQKERDVLAGLDGPAQAVAVELAVASAIGRNEVFGLLTCLLKSGKTEGRRASCNALARFRNAQAEHYVLEALHDREPTVRAAAVRQLRNRGVLDAMERLVTLLDDPAAEIRDAARSSLAEFNFIRYESLYDSLDEKTRKSTGKLVGKVDPSACRRLAGMLSSPSPSTKLRGLEMVVTMRLADEVRDQLFRLLEDSDLAIRADAATALGLCTNADVLPALRKAECDAHRPVREAAERSIDQIAQNLVLGTGEPLAPGHAT
jgi:HEAT repeat protein